MVVQSFRSFWKFAKSISNARQGTVYNRKRQKEIPIRRPLGVRRVGTTVLSWDNTWGGHSLSSMVSPLPPPPPHSTHHGNHLFKRFQDFPRVCIAEAVSRDGGEIWCVVTVPFRMFIDAHTDAKIQRVLREQFGPPCTTLTIAHRLSRKQTWKRSGGD